MVVLQVRPNGSLEWTRLFGGGPSFVSGVLRVYSHRQTDLRSLISSRMSFLLSLLTLSHPLQLLLSPDGMAALDPLE